MSTIRANCPTCGDIQLTAYDITVMVCSDDDQGSYNFLCPECRVRVSKNTSKRVVDLLLDSACVLKIWRLPKRQYMIGESFTADDMIDFYLLLENEEQFNQFIHNLEVAN